MVLEGPESQPMKEAGWWGTMNQDLRPIHGILSAHGRTQTETWSCLVCDSRQPWSKETCSTCNRDRIPPWLLDVHERSILPGSLVRCPSDSVRYAVQPLPPAFLLSPSSSGLGAPTSPVSNGRPTTPPMVQAAISTPPRTAGARASASSRSPPISPGRIAGVVSRMRVTTKHSSSASPSPSARSVTRTETSYRGDGGEGFSPANSWSPRRTKGVPAWSPSPKASKIGSNSTGSATTPANSHRQKRGREESVLEDANAALKARFEAQSEARRAVMVTAVHGVRPQPPHASRSLEGYCILEGDDGQAMSRALVKVVVDMKFRHETMAEGEIKLRNLAELEAQIETRKAALRAARAAHKDVIEATERLKAIREEIRTIRRAIEPLIMSCPFCLWNCAPLFTPPSTSGGGQACRLAPI